MMKPLTKVEIHLTFFVPYEQSEGIERLRANNSDVYSKFETSDCTMILTAYLHLRPVYQGLYIYSNFAFHYLIIVKQNNVPRSIILFTKKKQKMYSE